MTLYTEVEWQKHFGGKISGIQPGSAAAEIGLQIGDDLLAINNNKVDDVIDVQFHSAEEYLELLVRRGGELILFEAQRDYYQPLGIDFTHPTFDTDIRRCNNLCEFCFVLQMAPRFRRTLYIKDDDYRYSFLFGHYVTLTNLNESDWLKIENMRLSPLYVSVHVTDLEMRRQFLRNPNAPDILIQLRRLAEAGIELHTQLVIVPGFNDGRWLSQSVDELTKFWPAVRSVSIVPVGLTKHHKYGMRPHTVQEAEAVLDQVEALQIQFRKLFGVAFIYPTDEWYLVTGRPVPQIDAYDNLHLEENGLGMVRAFLDEWQLLKKEITAWHTQNGEESKNPTFKKYRSVTLITGKLFAETLATIGKEFEALTGINVSTFSITNERLGPSITVAGLLMVYDVLNQLRDFDEVGNLVIMPRVMFDHPDHISLDDVTPQEVANRIDRPVALADSMGDVWDALLGRLGLFFQPEVI